MKLSRFRIGFLLMILCLSISACTSTREDILSNPIVAVNEEIEESEEIEENIEIPEPVQIRISAVGDIMVHIPQITAQYNHATKKHDFTNNFQFVKPYIERADLALVNLETTFAGEAQGYSGYPRFNSPDELAYALKKAGFKGVVTTNNHTFDTGELGLLRTIEVLEQYELKPIGTKKQESDESYHIFDIKGIKVGSTAYTYETPPWQGLKTLNGIPVPKELEGNIDSFDYGKLEMDLLKMKRRIQEMKEQGAEVIVFYMHWGHEYHRKPNTHQKQIAQALSNYGVDIIFGSHPHVIQPIEWVQSEVDKHKTLVVYSMGNFISNQRYETLENRYTEDGVIVNVDMVKNFEEQTIKIEEVTIIPTWVNRYWQEGKRMYEILPLIIDIQDPQDYNLTRDSIKRVQNSKETTISHLLREMEGFVLEKNN
ncbi:CapA domain protein [Alkaliphilus metalliredigens QYMF]|uniref:CapA domain protein n=1 Tax=Alkaliphilus metalliredigens (strain QYMF) TaxID=293826 RepID=A6TMY4_ALKMQ|nr:CapA family protein [Alkaliphilus metalliredigens]ABR47552.1 CapA domain protein [Alkaliphilus metalliredigens QYMF]